ncbi:HAMP domain-containing histidine kinase [Azospirillum sp. RWY-5-1]|uniref:histidine kinase n=1 Tax=Azospirillum oleiclasticum TaxID=2735135 RepID=A0ABX2TDL2_9PROT|nr:HAMP domain-containing sensor histidine kinase [Azospirillum oleiclasticum]NYZ14760.1 HAMP domain-containing histidine kinase [Azospirillum oleiclasticum]NYZ22254.1 HAMP domain-containing histidine kinase [Azospirillum oleiclasticum]
MRPSPVSRSLSAKLLLLTVLFVMLAEVLIYTPSIARFRLAYLQEKLASAHLAALSVEAAPDLMVNKALQRKLLDHVGAHMIDLIQPDARVYMLSAAMPPRVDATVDLRTAGTADMILDAFAALFRRGDRVIRVVDRSPRDPALRVELVMDERPMITAMHDFSGRILGLSIVISLITAGLVFLSLNGLFVRPLRRLTQAIVEFSRDPENAARTLTPERRTDELGVAQRELATMQDTLSTALRQRERLAALGTAVAKINHDLRAILSTAALLSEHLGESADPEVRRVTPRLMASIDRAVELCGQTLSYTQDGVLPLDRRPVDLAALVDEMGPQVLAALRPDGQRVEALWDNRVPPGLCVPADPVQLARALANLGRNAVQAGAERVVVSAEAAEGRVLLTVADDGPGLPPRALANLFQPFAGSARAGGIGLGLAIAREILRAHGGDLRLAETGEAGTVFTAELPGAIESPASSVPD